ncbi:MAG: GIY-YIG nuclease family protein [Betaproteobacteria bacterium AqS2]|uniref:GIY-YIG nuclease family protein n=1 Tax=Candidatus Amphirhobacter heronislandensis TaxID=1732024 RepID=A0A930UCS1_9GAMM|nr:GIY-YIG nuclease family protein [Betaproteobacteria bacterium AqS2]
MKNYIVYKLFDKNGKVVWVGSTPLSIEERLGQHHFYGMEFASHEVLDRTFASQKAAMKEEGRLIKECIDTDGALPHYVRRAYCPS